MSRRLLLTLLVVASALAPARALAQVNLLGATGLGRRVLALDARARAMGGAGVALHGGNLSAINPAAAARFNASGIWTTYMPERRKVEGELANGSVTTEDVPVIRLVFPWGGRWAVGVSAGAYLDQDWGVQFFDTLNLATGEVPYEEIRTSDGGVSQVRLDLAGIIAEDWSLGGSFLFYTGQSRRRVSRGFEADVEFIPFQKSVAIDYRGWGLALGLEFQPIPEMILGASGSWAEGLTISNDTTGESLSIGLPLSFNLGGSWQLTPDLLTALSFYWEGWEGVVDDLPNATAVDIWGVGGGVELALSRGENSSLFVRGGGHLDRLPFEVSGATVSDRGLSLGAGVILGGGRARFDTSFELGKRGNIDKNGVEESYTRFSFGAAVFAR